MTSGKKKILGFVSIWPFLYVPIFMAYVFYMGLSLDSQQSGMPTSFFLVVPVHLLTMVSIIGLQIYYVLHVIRGDLEQNQKALWVILLMFFNMFAFPFYWYKFLWKEKQPESAHPSY